MQTPGPPAAWDGGRGPAKREARAGVAPRGWDEKLPLASESAQARATQLGHRKISVFCQLFLTWDCARSTSSHGVCCHALAAKDARTGSSRGLLAAEPLQGGRAADSWRRLGDQGGALPADQAGPRTSSSRLERGPAPQRQLSA